MVLSSALLGETARAGERVLSCLQLQGVYGLAGRMSLPATAFCALLLAGCVAPGEEAPPAAGAAGLETTAGEGAIACELPRPQVCTMLYAPVCALQHSGDYADYSSPCNACADDQVAAYVAGPCTDGGPAPGGPDTPGLPAGPAGAEP